MLKEAWDGKGSWKLGKGLTAGVMGAAQACAPARLGSGPSPAPKPYQPPLGITFLLCYILWFSDSVPGSEAPGKQDA